jgi:hypothetical protein
MTYKFAACRTPWEGGSVTVKTSAARAPPFLLRFFELISKNRTEERLVKNYTDSDYALNRYSAGIVYRFADGTTTTFTLADHLAEKPGKTEDDNIGDDNIGDDNIGDDNSKKKGFDNTETGFLKLKKQSDDDYLARDRAENAHTKKNSRYNELDEPMHGHMPSPEDLYIDAINAREEAERREQRMNMAKRALDTLTDVQRRRYLLRHVDGLSTWRIAELECVNQSKIVNSLALADKKIKKFLAAEEKQGFKPGLKVR